MSASQIIDLEEYTEFRTALGIRPHRVAHGTSALLFAFLIVAIAWLALTQANLVVVGRGEIRPKSDMGSPTPNVSSDISSETVGRVTKVLVKEGDKVCKGDTLVKLDDQSISAEIAKLEITLVSGRTRLQELSKTWETTWRKFRASVQTERAKPSASTGPIITERNLALQKLSSEAKRTQETLKTVEIELQLKRQELAKTCIRALQDGFVTECSVKVGDVVQVGLIGMRVNRYDGFEFEATIGNKDIAFVRTGMDVNVKIDALDFQRFGVVTGKVISVAPDSTQPGNATTSAARRTSAKAARGRMYIARVSLQETTLQRGDKEGHLKLGMTGNAEIVTDRSSLLRILARTMSRKISLN